MKLFTLQGFIMTVSHNLGYPRIGAKRELKKSDGSVLARRTIKAGIGKSRERAKTLSIAYVVARQKALGLDVPVHGEAERNDMVEYFGGQPEGFAFTCFGWVQNYGSRCFKPLIVFGDITRPVAMTVRWTEYAQLLTDKPMMWMVNLMEKALEKIPAEWLWVNPDCGLKTRGWAEVDPALANKVEAANQLRQRYDWALE